MPTINNLSQIIVTPEKFLEACSPTELMETDLLLCSPRFRNQFAEPEEQGFGKILKNPENTDYTDLQYLPEEKQLLSKLFPANLTEALPVVIEIAERLEIGIGAVIKLMPAFKKLESFRVKSLVAIPQISVSSDEKS